MIHYPENLIYPVKKVRTDQILPGFITNSYNSHSIVVTTPFGEKVVNSCSDEYSLISNYRIINSLVGPLANRGVTVQGHNWNDAVFSIMIAVKNPLEKAKVDTLYPALRILNSYNGKIRCIINMAIFRVVCSNGASIPMDLFHNSEYSHTPSNNEDIMVDRILNSFEDFLGNVDKVSEVYDELKGVPVFNVENRVDEVIEGTKFPEKYREDVIDRINLERAKYSFKITDWLVYNGFNFQLNHHEELAWDPVKRDRVDQAILNFLLQN